VSEPASEAAPADAAAATILDVVDPLVFPAILSSTATIVPVSVDAAAAAPSIDETATSPATGEAEARPEANLGAATLALGGLAALWQGERSREKRKRRDNVAG
jgi:hypothetical protein